MSKEIDTKIECCEIWNSLKDKTKMIDFLINAKTEINQLKQENERLFLQLSKQEIDEHKPAYCTLAGTDCKYLGKVEELKQQLEEKGKEINIKNNKLCELKKQLQNCQNEIIRLKASNKNLMSVIWKTKREKANKGRQVCQSQNESIKYKKLLDKSEQNQKLLAIQELEKVKEYCDKQFFSWENTNFNETYDNKDVSHAYYDVGFVIQQQINALEGEKDGNNK